MPCWRYPRCSTANSLVAGSAHKSCAAFLLCFGKPGSDFLEGSEVLVNVGFGVLYGDRPLLIPPVGLRQHAAVHHAEPILPPEVDINLGPVAIVADFAG